MVQLLEYAQLRYTWVGICPTKIHMGWNMPDYDSRVGICPTKIYMGLNMPDEDTRVGNARLRYMGWNILSLA
jgi:hypothetical protein